MLRYLVQAAAEPTPDSSGVLIPTIGTVAVALIGAVVALVTSRRPPTSHTQEPNAILPREVNEFWSAEIAKKDARIEEQDDEIATWMRRAFEAGWRE